MTPELKKLLDKRISVKLNAKRAVSGRLRGFDHFLNLVLDEAVDETEKRDIGLIVSRFLRAVPRVVEEPTAQHEPSGFMAS